MSKRQLIACFCAGVAVAGVARAEPPPFDLAGPTLRVSVTHAGVTLPIAEAPNLSEGDELSIEADLPASQSVRYLLIAAFLRGATNPPPPRPWMARNTISAGMLQASPHSSEPRRNRAVLPR